MSQTFFSKLDQAEKNNRLKSIAHTRGHVTVWVKGEKEKHTFPATNYDSETTALALDTRDDIFPNNSQVLCSFEFRGMNFFSQTVFQKSVGGFACLKFTDILYKSEKRQAFRLMTFPQHFVWAVFDFSTVSQPPGGKVIDLRTKKSQTGLFSDFLDLVEGDESNPSLLKIRVQDLSTTGMALHIGTLESQFFPKDAVFKNVKIKFEDDEVIIPSVKIMYAASFTGSDKNIKKFKLGIQFENVTSALDLWLGKKINSLLRESDHNTDFEKFKK
jgi:hypothetical protein